MEVVLDVYHGEYDERHVLICMDEASRQILSDLSTPLPSRPKRGQKPGTWKRVDDKYVRGGVRSMLLFYNPLDGWRRIGCRESRTRVDWAEEVHCLLQQDYPRAETVTLVCDNLNIHSLASLYHRYDAETAGNLRRRLNLVFTPKNGSWLNMAEMELSILSRQCLRERRFGTAENFDSAVDAWVADRNARSCGTTWRFTTADARIKLQSLYPKRDI
jgi:hypothetical protein